MTSATSPFAGRSAPARCGSSCGCAAEATGETGGTDPAAMAGDHTVPAACTLGAGEMTTRLDEWRALLDHASGSDRGVVGRRALDDGGLRLELAPNSDVTEIARLAAAEHGCCRFFAFAIVIDARGLALEVHAPPDGQPVLADLFGTAD